MLWGVVASHAGLSTAYFGIAGGMVLSAALSARLRLAADETADHTPAHHWADHVVDGEPPLDAGPVMIQVEYCVEPEHAVAFRAAMVELGRQRRLHGVDRWWILRDPADPSTRRDLIRRRAGTCYHERVSVRLGGRERCNLSPEGVRPITTRHQSRRSAPSTEGDRAVEERTKVSAGGRRITGRRGLAAPTTRCRPE